MLSGGRMNKDLTSSLVARKNVLNNPYALTQLETNLRLGGLHFEGETVFTKQQTADILAVDERTVDRYLSSHSEELKGSTLSLCRRHRCRRHKS